MLAVALRPGCSRAADFMTLFGCRRSGVRLFGPCSGMGVPLIGSMSLLTSFLRGKYTIACGHPITILFRFRCGEGIAVFRLVNRRPQAQGQSIEPYHLFTPQQSPPQFLPEPSKTLKSSLEPGWSFQFCRPFVICHRISAFGSLRHGSDSDAYEWPQLCTLMKMEIHSDSTAAGTRS